MSLFIFSTGSHLRRKGQFSWKEEGPREKGGKFLIEMGELRKKGEDDSEKEEKRSAIHLEEKKCDGGKEKGE